MTPAAGALLKLLGSGVNLIQQPSARPASIEGASFQDLLDRLRDGTLRDGEPIKLGAESKLELTPQQLERLGDAAAELERKGAQRAVVLLDGMAIEYDVGTRTVVGLIDPEDTEAVSGIDAFVHAPAEPGGRVLTAPSFSPAPSLSLLEALTRQPSD